ncbi:MAG TPA: DUF2934 domain-containing protein [Candidatus Acidoferrum sp.]|jgi:hypothetical protein
MKTRESSSPKVRKPRATKKHPSHEDIALRAYHIYLERHGAPGNPHEDWTRAERELMEQPKKARRKATVTSIAA